MSSHDAPRPQGPSQPITDLVLVLGDQLSLSQPALAATCPERARILMAEVPGESLAPLSSRIRTALFLSAMRHFALQLRESGWTVDYQRLGQHSHHDLAAAWTQAIRDYAPHRVLCTAPGDWRVQHMLETTCSQLGVALELLEDTHFLISRETFSRWAGRSRTLQMERFYRHMRVSQKVLMQGDEPRGGQWNFDADNRASFGRKGPGHIPPPPRFAWDEITRNVMQDVARHLPKLPGTTAAPDTEAHGERKALAQLKAPPQVEPLTEVEDAAAWVWPVNREQALIALQDFIHHRLALFGPTQDAMWSGEPFLHHSLIAAALNLKLLDPREVIAAAEQALDQGQVSIASSEGFIRQILGWREFMRGVYWLDMPSMRQANHFNHTQPLPDWFWSGKTQMNCLRESITQTLDSGYAHHIQRLMVIGNFALLAGLDPKAVEDWFLAVYVDAVEWVELPNVAGMALYANGGRFTTKPYCASGAYIKRMSNYCSGCRYDPALRTGPRACPITTLYWDFLIRNESEFAANPRAALMMKHVEKLDRDARQAIRDTALERLQSLNTL